MDRMRALVSMVTSDRNVQSCKVSTSLPRGLAGALSIRHSFKVHLCPFSQNFLIPDIGISAAEGDASMRRQKTIRQPDLRQLWYRLLLVRLCLKQRRKRAARSHHICQCIAIERGEKRLLRQSERSS